MKILIDENIPLTTVRALRAQGHDVLDIRGTVDEGIPDYALCEMAQREEQLLITTDKGFVHHREQPHHGILIIRLRQPNRRKKKFFAPHPVFLLKIPQLLLCVKDALVDKTFF